MDKQDKTPLVSVIVPAYNAEKLLDRCLKSIRRQSLRNIEIVVVNDGSTDRTAKILAHHAAEDARVIPCAHEKNKGLFAARITGFKASHGDYIAYVDADDEISIDWLRLLYEEAVAHNNDITAGQFFNKYDDGRMEYFNLDPLRQEMHLEGEEVFARFMEQEGGCYSWQLVWNKLYSRALWDRVLADVEHFSEAVGHFVMCEDIAFSAALWSAAERMSNVTSGAIYYYYRYDGQSTTHVKDKSVVLKRVADVNKAFAFMEYCIKKYRNHPIYFSQMRKWKLHYAQIYYGFLKKCKGVSKKESCATICEHFAMTESELEQKNDAEGYFYSVSTRVDQKRFDAMESLKARICSERTAVVSFDVFDTLVVRPFAQPTDLFLLLDDDFHRLAGLSSYVSFAEIRVLSEYQARQRVMAENKGFEEITLDEIYEQLGMDYGIASDVLDTMKTKEKELEIRFCTARKMGKQLFDLAKSQGKRVIACSDMYLPEKTIAKILSQNGYECDCIYMSSELRVAKWSGRLFAHVQQEMGLPKHAFLHIGDNLESDVVKAKSAGWQSAHLAKAMDQFKNQVTGAYNGEWFANLCYYHGLMRDGLNADRAFLGYRCALALTANRFFDDPFVNISEHSDLNADPFRVGYAAIGPYLYAVTEWIIRNIKQKNAERIHFVARDGYLPMEAYREFKKYDSTLPEENYLYISRKALALVDVYKAEDIYSFWSKYPPANYSPYKFDRILSPYYRDGLAPMQALLSLTDEEFKANFKNREQYDAILHAMSAYLDFGKLEAQKDELRAYFADIVGKNNLMFDIGYSGRGEAALTRLLNYPVDSLYIHSNSQAVNDRERLFGFETKCFYDYKPAITGVVREHVFMKQAPSTIGYEKVDGKMQPLFEEEKVNAAEHIMTRTLQSAAVEFVRDMCSIFEGYTDCLTYRKDDFAYFFEYYLHYSKPLDRQIFSCVVFEDEMGYGKAFSALDFWNKDAEIFRLQCFSTATVGNAFMSMTQDEKLRETFMPYPRWKKALCYLILDFKHFRQSLKRLVSRSDK